ncbi:tRNA (adenine(22)-N(1))-methyltransferase [Metabacillus sp. RGM 3146]|uniref:tRNA (adenine(22)-N(1))-methyltransferase n=1 Tax=Metabacillus sp. RGM 3146 TaxID=3401092 RepID=UPI003B9D7F71
MNETKLSRRLQKVADYIPHGAILADIGSDHAYLPCYAVKHQLASKAIAGEVVDGPFRSAMQQVQKSGLTGLVEVRKGDGLEVIAAGEVTCVSIAGMGGGLITKILEQGKEKLNGSERLILQPNIHANHIRKWLLDNMWELKDESILEEDSKIYEILIAEKGNPDASYRGMDLDAGILLGPYLAKEKDPVFLKKWSLELKHWEGIIQKLDKSAANHENQEKKEELKKLIAMVKEEALNE